MRTIKFRGKDIETGEWRYGFYTQGAMIDPISGAETVRHIIDSDILYDIDPETLGQFTGLVDLYENEVYEGDIVTLDGDSDFGNRIVAFYDQAFCLVNTDEYISIKQGQNPHLFDYARATCLNEYSSTGLIKVVGNVFSQD